MNRRQIVKGIRNPIAAFNYIGEYIRGLYYRIKYIRLGKKVVIGKCLRVRGRLSIRGPGSVIIGNNVRINGTLNPVTTWTYSKEAVISIGDNVYLNGTRFGCRKKIDIGSDCIVADCRLLDTDHHSIIPSLRHDPSAIKSAPIKIGHNVWISMDCVILKGVNIGDNSVISPKSVVMNNVPTNCLFGGNPAKYIKLLSDS